MTGDLIIRPKSLGNEFDIYILVRVKFPKDEILKVGSYDVCLEYKKKIDLKRNITNGTN